MARFGTGIQAGLGAINYTPYMQGAMAGSQSIAQGIASLGQAASGAINTYYAKKEEDKKKEEAANSFIKTVEANPSAFQGYLKDGKVDKEAIRTMVDTLGVPGTLQLNTYLAEAAKQQKAEKTKGEAARYADFLTTQSAPTAGEPEFMSNLRNFRQNQEFAGLSPEARRAGQAMALEQQIGQAQLGKTLAETQALLNPTPKEPNNEAAQIQREAEAFTLQTGRQPNAIEFAQIGARVRQQNSAQTNINVGERGAINALDTLAKSKFVPQSEKINEYVNQANSLKVMESLLNSGVVDKNGRVVKDNQIITGWLAGAERDVKSALNKIGLTNFRDVAATDVYLNAAYKQLAAAVQAFGSGTAISDTDLKTAAKIIAGDPSVSAEALREMIKNYKIDIGNQIQRFNKSVEKTFTSPSPEIDNTASFYRNAFLVPETDYQYFLSTGAGGGMFDQQGNALGVGGQNAALESGEYEIVNGRVVRKKK